MSSPKNGVEELSNTEIRRTVTLYPAISGSTAVTSSENGGVHVSRTWESLLDILRDPTGSKVPTRDRYGN